MKNGNESAMGLVLSDIAARLAAITPEQFVAPSGLSPTEKGVNFVIAANDGVKRLFTLRAALANECQALSENGARIAKSALRDVFTKDPDEVVKELETPDSPAQKTQAELERLQNELRQVERVAEIVDSTFWLEVRRQHPDLEFKSRVCICNDWSLGWQEEDEDEEGAGGMRIRILGAGPGMTGLAELLMGRDSR